MNKKSSKRTTWFRITCKIKYIRWYKLVRDRLIVSKLVSKYFWDNYFTDGVYKIIMDLIVAGWIQK